jgi:uncharacterized protein (UPF0332 family)
MGKAETALASARLLLEAGDSDGTINRAYYAMFDAATAALRWAGTAENPLKTHGGMIASFGRNLVQTGRLSPELGRSLNRMHELRVTADYLAEPVPLDKARQGSRKRQRSLAQSVSCWTRHPGNAGRRRRETVLTARARRNARSDRGYCPTGSCSFRGLQVAAAWHWRGRHSRGGNRNAGATTTEHGVQQSRLFADCQRSCGTSCCRRSPAVTSGPRRQVASRHPIAVPAAHPPARATTPPRPPDASDCARLRAAGKGSRCRPRATHQRAHRARSRGNVRPAGAASGPAPGSALPLKPRRRPDRSTRVLR